MQSPIPLLPTEMNKCLALFSVFWDWKEQLANGIILKSEEFVANNFFVISTRNFKHIILLCIFIIFKISEYLKNYKVKHCYTQGKVSMRMICNEIY